MFEMNWYTLSCDIFDRMLATNVDLFFNLLLLHFLASQALPFSCSTVHLHGTYLFESKHVKQFDSSQKNRFLM